MFVTEPSEVDLDDVPIQSTLDVLDRTPLAPEEPIAGVEVTVAGGPALLDAESPATSPEVEASSAEAAAIAGAGHAATAGLNLAVAAAGALARRGAATLSAAAATAQDHRADQDMVARDRNVAGASAQAEFERRLTRHRARALAALPTTFAITLLGMAAAVFALTPYGRLVAALGAAAVGLTGASFIGRLPADAMRWRRRAAGERRTAASLAALEPEGYVVLHDRTVPGIQPNIDHIVIGPAGVFVIETRPVRGTFAAVGEKLFVGGHATTPVVEDTYREAVAVQIAMADTLGPAGLTVQPIVCVHGVHQRLLEDEVQGLRVVSGTELAGFLRGRPMLLGAEAIQSIAAATERRLRPATL